MCQAFSVVQLTCDIVVLYGLGAGFACIQHSIPGKGGLGQAESQGAKGGDSEGDLGKGGEGQARRRFPGLRGSC